MGYIAQRCHEAYLRVPVMTPELHGDNYYYHLLMLYLPKQQETEELLGEYSTAQEAPLAKRDQLHFRNSEHDSFADEWTLFITCLRLLFYFVFRTRSICFRNIYRLQMALGV